MNKEDLILACFAASEGEYYQPVQIQKLVFLFQKRATSVIPSPLFNFNPHDYGPFDTDVYNVIEELSEKGFVDIDYAPLNRYKLYKYSEIGKNAAVKALESISEPYQTFLKDLSKWVRSLSFAQLVGAVYKAYPEMKVNSVFRG